MEEYKNDTKEAKRIRLTEKVLQGMPQYRWITVKPGEVIECDVEIAKGYGLKKVNGEDPVILGFEDMTVKQLKVIAKDKGLDIPSKIKKPALIEWIKESEKKAKAEESIDSIDEDQKDSVEEKSDEEKAEDEAKEKRDALFKKLCKLNGIGAATANDITSVFKTEEELVLAIEEDKELPFREDVVKILKEASK